MVEGSLCLAENIVNGVFGFEKSVDVRGIALVGESKLILQVIKAVVDRRCRQHQYLCLDSGSNHFVHQLEITVLARVLIVLIGSYFATIAEVVAFIYNHEVVVAPVDAFKVCTIRIAVGTRKVGVIKHIITEAVVNQWVIYIIAPVSNPVVKQFLRAQNENRLVAVFVILNDRKSGERLAKTYAVGKNAAVKLLQLVDDSESGIALEVVKFIPDNARLEAGCLIRQHVF